MKAHPILLFALTLFAFVTSVFAVEQPATSQNDKHRLRELDAYWATVSRTVGEGEFEGDKRVASRVG